MRTSALVFMLLPVLGHVDASSDVNIARGGKVTQSSVGWNGLPERAIDGNRASNWPQESCTHTNDDQNPWWRLDLLQTYKINTVTITNRQDCCPERLNGAEIRIGNSLNDNGNANPSCAVITSIPAGMTKTFECKGMEGRYVNIVIPGRKEYLTLCEVEVNGQLVGNCGQGMAFLKSKLKLVLESCVKIVFTFFVTVQMSTSLEVEK
ncbi:fucolectin-like [Parambassis ranga]|uniref:Fucolectin-like n=1 Tax=Parambassis ranga TaxID=210632 RepID=A0A6P7JX30_9TELE|nr:fucolectin-like [Parambassis ranga]XP_028281534.1 fucolectin-like [Parambassis ranga]